MSATVKRKLNSLLGFGTRPESDEQRPSSDLPPSDPAVLDDAAGSTSLGRRPSSASSMTSDLEFLAKKRRIGAAASKPSFASLLNDSSSQSPIQVGRAPTTISNVTLRKWTPNGTTVTAANNRPPKYCPGDREQLVRRLATFQELTDWTPKPNRVSEIEWAKFGWICTGKERVKCTLCHKELVVKLNRKEVEGKEVSVLVSSEIADALVDKYVELMVTSHQEDCLWKKKGCDDSLLRLPLLDPNAMLKSLRKRYDELLERKDFLPYEFNLRVPDGLDLDSILSQLPTNFFTEPPPSARITPPTGLTLPTPPPNRSALALAILGWQGLANARGGPVPNSASCHTCLRRLGLWMFKSKQVDPDTNTVLVPAAMDHLDPLREHRFFCPWRNGTVQRNPGAKPLAAGEEHKAAWQLLVQSIRNEAFVRSRRVNGLTRAHGRSRSSIPAQSSAAVVPSTPARPTTAHSAGDKTPGLAVNGTSVEDAVEDEETRTKKDQAMMARLKRVKSLFKSKGSTLKRGSSRPGTSHSTAGGAE